MSGIFKGDSIYKSGGGGGGGYKDGGQLVDGDFIKVENNTVSSYDNVSRDPVNFYFEVKEGEVLNSIIEFTTQINSIVNVYIVKDGFWYLLGVSGSNSATAGDDYNININGDSYGLEQVNYNNPEPSINVNGGIYGVKKIGSQWWTTQDYDHGGTNGKFIDPRTFDNISNNLSNGWRIPLNSDFDTLKTYCISTYGNAVSSVRTNYGWGTTYNNDSGFSAYPNGILNVWQGNIIQFAGSKVCYWTINKAAANEWFFYSMDDNGFNNGGAFGPNDYKYCLRFVKDV
jgi:uncharacterized protein (TIGR02145 family)